MADFEPTFSYWERTAFTGGADVIVIGSGLVGLSAALHLKTQEPSLKVLVLERGFLPTGASTKNAGFACFGTVSEQLEGLKRSSDEEVAQLAGYKWRGLQRLRKNLGDSNTNPRSTWDAGSCARRSAAHFCRAASSKSPGQCAATEYSVFTQTS